MNWISVNDSLPLDDAKYLVTDGVNVTSACYLRRTNITGWTVTSEFPPITYWGQNPSPPQTKAS